MGSSPAKILLLMCFCHIKHHHDVAVFCYIFPDVFSFYVSKMILETCFGRIQISLVRLKLDFSGLISITCTCPK